MSYYYITSEAALVLPEQAEDPEDIGPGWSETDLAGYTAKVAEVRLLNADLMQREADADALILSGVPEGVARRLFGLEG